MNILLVTMALGIGGVETHITELAKELVRRGNSVTVASSGGVYVGVLEKAGVCHETMPLDSRSPASLRAAYARLRSLTAPGKDGNNPFDIVHAHARIPCLLCGLIHRKNRKAFHYVTTVHGVYRLFPGASLLTDWGERSLAVSEDAKEYLVKGYRVSPENIKVTVNGIDTESFTPADADRRKKAEELLGISGKSYHRVVHVSRLDSASSDAAVQLIEAAPELSEAYPDTEIVIVGGGTELEALREKAEGINSALGRRAVFMTGARPDIADILPCGDCFVGVSRAALEAMACGLPTVLAGAQGFFGLFDESEESIKKSVETNFCFRGCGQSSSEKIRDSLLALFLLPPERRSELGRYSRETVKRLYSVSRMTDDAEEMYHEVLS